MSRDTVSEFRKTALEDEDSPEYRNEAEFLRITEDLIELFPEAQPLVESLTVLRDTELSGVEAERDLFRNCCMRALDRWTKLHPDAECWPDGAMQIVELLSRLEKICELLGEGI